MRLPMHFSAASASWLNRVEQFITTERLRNGVFRSRPELIPAIKESSALHNQNPKPCQAACACGRQPRPERNDNTR